MNRKLQVVKYILSDSIAAAAAYFAVFTFRKSVIEPKMFGDNVLVLYDQKFFLSLIAIVLFWVGIFSITGIYSSIYRRSRLKEFIQTFTASLLGSIFLFFSIILLIATQINNSNLFVMSFSSFGCKLNLVNFNISAIIFLVAH